METTYSEWGRQGENSQNFKIQGIKKSIKQKKREAKMNENLNFWVQIFHKLSSSENKGSS